MELQKNIYLGITDYAKAKAKAFECVDHNKLWKILKEMRIPDHLPCLLRNLYTGQEETVRIRHGTTDWFKIGKGVCQGGILSPCLFSLYTEISCEMPGWMNLRCNQEICRWHHPYGIKQREIKEPFNESERGEWKNWL